MYIYIYIYIIVIIIRICIIGIRMFYSISILLDSSLYYSSVSICIVILLYYH